MMWESIVMSGNKMGGNRVWWYMLQCPQYEGEGEKLVCKVKLMVPEA